MEYSRSLKCSKKDTGRLVYIELLFQGYPASSWVQHKKTADLARISISIALC